MRVTALLGYSSNYFIQQSSLFFTPPTWASGSCGAVDCPTYQEHFLFRQKNAAEDEFDFPSAVGEAAPAVGEPLMDRRRGAQRGPRGSSSSVRAVVPGGGRGPAARAPGLKRAAHGADALLWQHLLRVAVEPPCEGATMAGEDLRRCSDFGIQEKSFGAEAIQWGALVTLLATAK